jgi:hypothetical protein
VYGSLQTPLDAVQAEIAPLSAPTEPEPVTDTVSGHTGVIVVWSASSSLSVVGLAAARTDAFVRDRRRAFEATSTVTLIQRIVIVDRNASERVQLMRPEAAAPAGPR